MVIGLKLPVPLAVKPLRPAGGVIAVQVNEVPCTSAVKAACVVGRPLQTVCTPGLLSTGMGLTLNV